MIEKGKIFRRYLPAHSEKSLPFTVPAFNKRCFSTDAALLKLFSSQGGQRAHLAALTAEQRSNNAFNRYGVYCRWPGSKLTIQALCRNTVSHQLYILSYILLPPLLKESTFNGVKNTIRQLQNFLKQSSAFYHYPC